MDESMKTEKDKARIAWRREKRKLKQMRKRPDTDSVELSAQELKVSRLQREAGK